jgi:hypothetical protein
MAQQFIIIVAIVLVISIILWSMRKKEKETSPSKPTPPVPIPVIPPIPVTPVPIPVVPPIPVPTPVPPVVIPATIMAPLASQIKEGEIKINDAKAQLITTLSTMLGVDTSQTVLGVLKPETCSDPEDFTYNTLRWMEDINPEEYKKQIACNVVLNSLIIRVTAERYSTSYPINLGDLHLTMETIKSKLSQRLPQTFAYNGYGFRNYARSNNLNPYYKNRFFY